MKRSLLVPNLGHPESKESPSDYPSKSNPVSTFIQVMVESRGHGR